MTQSTLVVRHLAFEDLGIIEPLLRQRGHNIVYREAGVDELSTGEALAADLMIILGGPVGVYQTRQYPFLLEERAAIAARLEAGLPTLGICLGAQLMAAALGAPVTPSGRTEIGYSPLTLTPAGRAGVLAPLDGAPVLHWHGDVFAIPEGAERLAETPGFPQQAFALGPAVLGLQFHLEAQPEKIERWLIGHAHELAGAGIDPQLIRADAQRYGPGLAAAAGRVIEDWLDRAGLGH
ncbi:glutamine amidotransferase [Brevibacterium sp. 50QC2O2]|uniref:glutamine amidotransferase n=1 Tax=Brevibacterium sp. 50QC2O2 TaxID=2968459 RepID=UPI00211BB9C3|nr:glutamine amidotransferase [Brevibacterium sp. 50QC2O2]MCQ9387357.1 glutamine amidotransferase [Brevibacterium sp. 50QC2O2]